MYIHVYTSLKVKGGVEECSKAALVFRRCSIEQANRRHCWLVCLALYFLSRKRPPTVLNTCFFPMQAHRTCLPLSCQDGCPRDVDYIYGRFGKENSSLCCWKGKK